MEVTGYFDSSNGISKTAYYICNTHEKPKAVLQLTHGMCEYIGRYAHFIDYLKNHRIAVCGNDHIGHGNSVSNDDRLGYFAKKDGWLFLVKDLYIMNRIIKNNYPDLPVYLFGHSMGSFAARLYITQYGNTVDGVILCGTCGDKPESLFGIIIADIISKLKGDIYRSHTLNNLAFSAFTRKIDNPKTKSDWLTRDADTVDKFLKDKNCKFVFTASGFKDLFRLMLSVSGSRWAEKVPKTLPLFIISGDMDPVGQYGKGVNTVFNRLRKAGVKDIELKLYKECRHELINEINKYEIFDDILGWLNRHISKDGG